MQQKIILFILLFCCGMANAMNCSEYGSFKTYGGHYYTVTQKKFTFLEAKQFAVLNGGYIAIPNTQEENIFLSGIIQRDMAWIGIHDPNYIKNFCVNGVNCMSNSARFKTVKGENLLWSNWKEKEPNNAVYDDDYNIEGKPLVSPLGEYWVVLNTLGKWFDVGNHIGGNSKIIKHQAILEFDTVPQCGTAHTIEPDDMIDMTLRCDTQINYDDINKNVLHQSFICQYDTNNTPYCPFNLEECQQEWEYQTGTSTKHVKTITIPCDDGNDGCYTEKTYTYYDYNCSAGYTAQDIGGDCNLSDLIDFDFDGVGDFCNSSNPPFKNCRKEKFTCKSDSRTPCAKVDNRMQCSTQPCFNKDNIIDIDSPVGLEDRNNDGWQEDGKCVGEISLFSGYDKRCRSEDIAFGLMGGGCCKKDEVFFGLIECKEEEKILAQMNRSERCTYIGEYCAHKIKILGKTIGCSQYKKTWCCFNSKLARIINEQGREQLKGFTWGSSKNPQCKGFTPLQFEKLDFSRIDLSEVAGDLETSLYDSERLEEKFTQPFQK